MCAVMARRGRRPLATGAAMAPSTTMRAHLVHIVLSIDISFDSVYVCGQRRRRRFVQCVRLALPSALHVLSLRRSCLRKKECHARVRVIRRNTVEMNLLLYT